MSDPLATDPVLALLAQTALENTAFAANSRYLGISVATLQYGDRTVVYLTRRFLPAPSEFQTVQEHTVKQNERLDHIASQYLGDPTLFWRVCDANNAMRPDALTETPGRILLITLPQGITGTSL